MYYEDINIMKNEIKSEKCTRYLCAILDENIFQRTYQQKKCRTAMLKHQRIKCNRKYLTEETTEILVFLYP